VVAGTGTHAIDESHVENPWFGAAMLRDETIHSFDIVAVVD
jgi:hypothetical protein